MYFPVLRIKAIIVPTSFSFNFHIGTQRTNQTLVYMKQLHKTTYTSCYVV